MKIKRRIRAGSLLLAMVLSVSTLQPAYAAVTYMPDVTAEMSDATFWLSIMMDICLLLALVL